VTINYKALGQILGGRPNPLKLVVPTAPPAGDDAMRYAAEPAPPRAPAIPTQPAPQAPPQPVDVLLAALNAAADDACRAALIVAAPNTVRQELAGALAYREMTTVARNAPLDALVVALDATADDGRRGALLSAASPTVRAALAEQLFWRNVTTDDAQQQYLGLLGLCE
jgi:hypothetical protein